MSIHFANTNLDIAETDLPSVTLDDRSLSTGFSQVYLNDKTCNSTSNYLSKFSWKLEMKFNLQFIAISYERQLSRFRL